MNIEKSQVDFLFIIDSKDFFACDGSRVLLEQLSRVFDFDVFRVGRIIRGGNNSIFVLENNVGDRLLAKFYKKDDRLRLEREYCANKFLLENGFVVPKTHLRNDQYQFGIYSFEEGEHKQAAEVTAKDVDHLVDFIVQLQTFNPKDVSEFFHKASGAITSKQDILEDNRRRLQVICSMDQEGKIHPTVAEILKRTPYLDDIVQMTDRIIGKRSDSWWNISKKDQRLSPADFSFHNILFRKEEPPCILDLEYFGWDDPLHSVAEFISHDQTLGLSESLRSRFVDSYSKMKNLSPDEKEHFTDLIKINNIKWIAIYLQTLTPSRLFACPATTGMFDQEAFIQQQIKKIEQRRSSLKFE